jgi:hypothetical protein
MGWDEISTEDMKTAMIEYRSLFEELVQIQRPGRIKAVA